DAVTAHLGALDGRGGAITVLGTGAIALGHPGSDDHGHWCPGWSRVDGWGHLFGDRGGGAWLGRLGLELALRTHDGVDEYGSVLLEAAIRRFGLPASWPGRFYTRSDRAGLLAEFATDVAEAARSGDAASAELLDGAGREAARSALAAARAAPPRRARRVRSCADCADRGFGGSRGPPRRGLRCRIRPSAPGRHDRRPRGRAARRGADAGPPRRRREAERSGSGGLDLNPIRRILRPPRRLLWNVNIEPRRVSWPTPKTPTASSSEADRPESSPVCCSPAAESGSSSWRSTRTSSATSAATPSTPRPCGCSTNSASTTSSPASLTA